MMLIKNTILGIESTFDSTPSFASPQGARIIISNSLMIMDAINIRTNPTQPTIICSKLTTETLKQGVKHVQS